MEPDGLEGVASFVEVFCEVFDELAEIFVIILVAKSDEVADN